jgi:hypothetical protein
VLSPRTQAMAASPGAGTDASAQELFDSAFQEMVLNKFLARKPELASLVSTFQILDSDPETNTASGTLILEREGDEIHVPAVLADNELMPFDTMYVKSIDMMLPLNESWIQELSRMAATNMGSATAPPTFAQNDVDIRNVVVPPTTGRYSYASHGLNLPAYLAGAPDRVKKSFVATLERYPEMAKFAFSVYDVNDLQDALWAQANTKVAADTSPSLLFADIETPSSETRAIFGASTPRAMSDIASEGFAYKDSRRFAPTVVREEQPLHLSAPSLTGFYTVYLSNGSKAPALVLTSVLQPSTQHDRGFAARVETCTHRTQLRLVLLEGGKLIATEKEFMSSPLPLQEVPQSLRDILYGDGSTSPSNGQRGVFLSENEGSASSVVPIKVTTTYSKDGVRYSEGSFLDGVEVTIVQIPDSPIKTPRVLQSRDRFGNDPSGYDFRTDAESKRRTSSLRLMVPFDWKFHSISDYQGGDALVQDARAITAMFFNSLVDSGAERINIKSAGYGEFYIDGTYRDKVASVKYLAKDRGLRVHDAKDMLKEAAASLTRGAAFYAVAPVGAFRKLAAGEQGMDPSMMQGMDPSMMQGMDPSMMQGMDPSMMQGMDPSMMDPSMMDPSMMDPSMMGPPPGPSPVEMAAQEVAGSLMQQHDGLMQQMQQAQANLATQVEAINMVAMRAHEIAAESGMAPPMMPPQLVDPAMLGGMDPSMQGMDPSMQGMDPSMQGMDPSMQGMDPSMQGMDPSMQGGMPVEDPSMMESSMTLQDPNLFDASMIGTLATRDGIDESVSTYTPALRDALDGVGRMLTEVRIKSAPLRAQIGDRSYNDIRDKLETLFQDMGDTLTTVNSVITS